MDEAPAWLAVLLVVLALAGMMQLELTRLRHPAGNRRQRPGTARPKRAGPSTTDNPAGAGQPSAVEPSVEP